MKIPPISIFFLSVVAAFVIFIIVAATCQDGGGDGILAPCKGWRVYQVLNSPSADAGTHSVYQCAER
jgi:hypothetical protein